MHLRRIDYDNRPTGRCAERVANHRLLCAAILIGCSVVALTGPAALAATLHVPATYPTIMSAMVASAAGDSILIEPGTYTENIITGGHPVFLIGIGGANNTVIEGRPGDAVLKIVQSAYIEGLTDRKSVV